MVLTSISRNINDPVAVHPGLWNHPVNSGRRVSDIREADTRRWAQIWNKVGTKTSREHKAHFPYLVEHEFSVSTNWVKRQTRRDTRVTGTSPLKKKKKKKPNKKKKIKKRSWNSVGELSLSDKRDLSRLCLTEEDSPQPSTNRSILRDRPGEINLPPSLLWQHKSETCTMPPNSKALPPGRTRGQSPFYVTQIALPHNPSPNFAQSDLDTRDHATTFVEDEWMLRTIVEK